MAKTKKYSILLLAGGMIVAAIIMWSTSHPDADAQFMDLLSLADSIGELESLPTDDYWKEMIAADQEDEKEGYDSGLSYPGHRRPGSFSIMDRMWRPNTDKYGPRLKACYEKWRPVVEHNYEIGERRNVALKKLRHNINIKLQDIDDEFVSGLRSNIISRAHLSQKEADMIFSPGNTKISRLDQHE